MIKIQYKYVKDLFYKNRIFTNALTERILRRVNDIEKFKDLYPNNLSRLKDDDYLYFPDKFKIEQYVAFPRGGEVCSMGHMSYSCSPVNIQMSVGRYCSFASGVSIMPGSHVISRLTTSATTITDNYVPRNMCLYDHHITDAPVFPSIPFKKDGSVNIGHDVYLGTNCVIKPDVTIGTGAVVGAYSIVTKDVPPYTIVAGNPAKFIRLRFDMSIVAKLLESKWWIYDFDLIYDLPFDDPTRFLTILESRKSELDEIMALRASLGITERDILELIPK